MKGQILHRIIPILIVGLSAVGVFRQMVRVELFATLLPRFPLTNTLPPGNHC